MKKNVKVMLYLSDEEQQDVKEMIKDLDARTTKIGDFQQTGQLLVLYEGSGTKENDYTIFRLIADVTTPKRKKK